MTNQDRGGRSAGRRGGSRFNNRDRGPKTMHQTTCADCGGRCEVPFRPSGSRPVYCSDCFGKHNPRDERRGQAGFRDRNDRPMFRATCASCGNTCEVPFRPTGEKPVYCSDCFGDKGSRQGRVKPSGVSANADLIAEIKSLHAKIDKILGVVAPQVVHVVPQKKTAAKTATRKKAASKKKTVAAKKSAKKTDTKKSAKKK